jgi:hypothetical protein
MDQSSSLGVFELLDQVFLRQIVGKGLQRRCVACSAQSVIDQIPGCAVDESSEFFGVLQLTFAQRTDDCDQNILH